MRSRVEHLVCGVANASVPAHRQIAAKAIACSTRLIWGFMRSTNLHVRGHWHPKQEVEGAEFGVSVALVENQTLP